eukprot:scaffold87865_cov64-Cyclotella_meneghiniana.AAC.4
MKDGNMAEERVTKLNVIGFVFDPQPSKSPQKKNKIGPPPVKAKPPPPIPSNLEVTSADDAPSKALPGKSQQKKLSIQEFWDQRYNELVEFKGEHGHCNVPQKYENNLQLGIWVNNQRKAMKNYKLPKEKVIKLNEIGFEVDALKSNWEDYYYELVEYKNQHGNCNVPVRYEKNLQLGHWVDNQRTARKKEKLSGEKVIKLNEIGFAWKIQSSVRSSLTWDEQYYKLVMFKREYGDCNVPQGYAKDSPLGRWVAYQRDQFRHGKLQAEQMDKLNKLGFAWIAHQSTWDDNYNKLLEYKIRYQKPIGPVQQGGIGSQLGEWIHTQRQNFREGNLAEGRIKLLDEIDFAWKVSTCRKTWWATKISKPIPEKSSGFAAQNMDEWRKYYNELKKFFEEHGHWNVPSKRNGLKNWVYYQKRSFGERGKLNKKRLELLEEIGFPFEMPKLPKSLLS